MPQTPGYTVTMTRPVFFVRAAGIASALTALDLVTKDIAERRLAGRGVVPVLGDFFYFIHARNRGAFLSLGNSIDSALWPFLFIVLPLGVIVGFLVWMWLRGEYRLRSLVLCSLVVAGGAGNLYDRIALGSVRDFMVLGVGRLHTGIFNFADMYLMAFAALFAFGEFVSWRSSAGTTGQAPSPASTPGRESGGTPGSARSGRDGSDDEASPSGQDRPSEERRDSGI